MPIVDFRLEVDGSFEFDWDDYNVPLDERNRLTAELIASEHYYDPQYWIDDDFEVMDYQP